MMADKMPLGNLALECLVRKTMCSDPALVMKYAVTTIRQGAIPVPASIGARTIRLRPEPFGERAVRYEEPVAGISLERQ